ncbi:MAG: thiamine phosphate synthase [Boseongicola sp.]|nr:thiamine phosphate synthase [Boseongicola sp.]
MADDARPQIYLSTPPAFELSTFPDRIAEVLDAFDVACVRLSMATSDEDTLARAGDALRSVCHEADVALVIDTHVGLVERLGLDGVHLLDGARTIRAVRKSLGSDAIVGAFCGTSRHDGMTAGEIGADYISFGPAGDTTLGDGTKAERELFQWWSEMIELPVVAEGALTAEVIRDLAPVTDFFGIGEEVWREDDAVFALGQFIEAMS